MQPGRATQTARIHLFGGRKTGGALRWSSVCNRGGQAAGGKVFSAGAGSSGNSCRGDRDSAECRSAGRISAELRSVPEVHPSTKTKPGSMGHLEVRRRQERQYRANV